MSQLHDQHCGQVWIPLDEGEVELDEALQLLRRAPLLSQGCLHLGDEPGHLLVEEPQQQIVFSLEIQVDRTVRHARRAGDLGHGGAVESALGEHADRRIEDAPALVVRSAVARLHVADLRVERVSDPASPAE